MEKVIKLILTLGLLLLAIVLFAQEAPDTVVTVPGGSGFWGFYEKYSGVVWTLLGLVGVSGFITYRAQKIKASLDEVIKAAQDGHVTEAEFQAIVRAVKQIWGKKDN